MADPALQLVPAEEVIAEAAAKKTTELIVIEGGKKAAAAATGAALRTAVGAATGVGVLLILLSSSSTASDDTWTAHPPKTSSKPEPVPTQKPETVEKCSKESDEKCPPHDWELVSSKSVEKNLNDLQDEIDIASKNLETLKNMGENVTKESLDSAIGELRGHQFEKDALEINSKKKDVDSAGSKYTCKRCGQNQEIDIVFKDGQIAESKSSSSFKGKTKQAERLVDVQSFFNCQQRTNLKPLAKLDSNQENAKKVAKKYSDLGFDIESLDTTVKR